MAITLIAICFQNNDSRAVFHLLSHLSSCNRQQVQDQLNLRANADKRLSEISQKTSNLVDLKLEGSISEDIFKQKLSDLQNEQSHFKLLKTQNTINEEEFKVSMDEVLDLAKNVVNLFKSSPISQKREIIACVLVELQLKGKNLYFSYKKPFDLLAKGSETHKFYRGRDLNP